MVVAPRVMAYLFGGFLQELVLFYVFPEMTNLFWILLKVRRANLKKTKHND